MAGDGADGVRALLRGLFDAAVAAVAAPLCLPPALPAPPAGRVIVAGAGKAAAAMAAALEAHWAGPVERLSGLVITRHGHGCPTTRLEVVEAGHPLPDQAGLEATARILAEAGRLGAEDLLLCLLSGGGSALLVAPAPGLTLADKQAVGRALLLSGARIHEINAVRKHLSEVKGGRLAAAAHPARVVTLAISDVAGDDPATIASGPTVADPTTFAEARMVLARHAIAPPPAVRAHLDRAAEETPKPGDPRLARAEYRIIARAADALNAAARHAQRAGFAPLILGDAIEGEAREVARAHAERARAHMASGRPLALLSGGELTVRVTGAGRGGRNQEYALALALALAGAPGIAALAADTDGIDGTSEAAGAVVDASTLRRAARMGLDPVRMLAENNADQFFARLGDQVRTGPTRTNVNDFRAILIDPARLS